jgi:hypothetical protein
MDEFDHRCSDKDCPYLGQSTRFASCKCKVGREEMMLSAIGQLRNALAEAPRPLSTDPVVYMDWYFKVRGAALALKEPGR